MWRSRVKDLIINEMKSASQIHFFPHIGFVFIVFELVKLGFVYIYILREQALPSKELLSSLDVMIAVSGVICLTLVLGVHATHVTIASLIAALGWKVYNRDVRKNLYVDVGLTVKDALGSIIKESMDSLKWSVAIEIRKLQRTKGLESTGNKLEFLFLNSGEEGFDCNRDGVSEWRLKENVYGEKVAVHKRGFPHLLEWLGKCKPGTEKPSPQQKLADCAKGDCGL